MISDFTDDLDYENAKKNAQVLEKRGIIRRVLRGVYDKPNYSKVINVRRCDMQDRYAGDIGDFGKFGFLKFVENEGLKVGVNWYLTEPVTKKESRNNDGKYGVTKSNKKFH